MFIYNLKMNKKLLCRAFISVSLLIILCIIMYSIYIIFIRENKTCNSNQNNVINLDETNYANILKSSNENIDSYVGTKVKITGYIYRLIDFSDNQFVIARDMRFNNNSNSLVIGFLCESKDAHKYSDGTWVDVLGIIKKGKFNDDLAILDVISIKETNKPEKLFVNPPDNTYIPTSNIF